ncbi:PAN2-PAN3 deadenylation complex subunit pan3 isoform X1 [Octopus bimaculoides]|nr:PAN2-PAN3 deadenylation complex subunit pan3 isoform X1 [Octopus bimaculoides]
MADLEQCKGIGDPLGSVNPLNAINTATGPAQGPSVGASPCIFIVPNLSQVSRSRNNALNVENCGINNGACVNVGVNMLERAVMSPEEEHGEEVQSQEHQQQQERGFCDGPMSDADPGSNPNVDIVEDSAIQGISDSMANNGDQYFNATFRSSCHMTEFSPMMMRQRARVRSNFSGQLPQTVKTFLPGRVDENISENFAALNLSNSSPSHDTSGATIRDYVGKSPTALNHSSSSPSFTTYSQMTTISAPSPHVTPALNSSVSIISATSPSQSPRISPSNSPMLIRRTESPVSSLRQNTVGLKSASNTIQENVGGTTYFYSPEDFAPQFQSVQKEYIFHQQQQQPVVLPNYSFYPGMPSHIAHMKVKANMPQFFLPDEIKMELLNRHACSLMQIDPAQHPDIPTEVDSYHQLYPLEAPPANPLQKSSMFSYPSTCYKAVNTKDCLTYCLKRIHGFRLANTKCLATVDQWKKLYHPNVVQLKEVFTTTAFGDNSLIFVYDFHPVAETLMIRHFSASSTVNGYTTDTTRTFTGSKTSGVSNGPRQHAGLLPESLIWAYIVQLSSALRAIHTAGLACGVMDPTKILISSKSRLRINCIGIFDVLTFDSNQGNYVSLVPHYQQEDLVALGKVVLALACNSIMAIQREQVSNSLELVARNYSTDLKNLILYLMGSQRRQRSVNDIMPMIGARFYTQLDAAQLRSDVVENELAKEVENGRLFRLLCKLVTILERPEFSIDASWSETGDRYMLKLFRDYIFHQVDEHGTPWVDMAHIVDSLNKLDAGVMDKVTLMSRDEQTMLVVSYAELKQSFETAFTELLAATQHTNFA